MEEKDKREAPIGYPSSGHSSQTLQYQPSHEDSNAISIGAGYSIGGSKPNFAYAGHVPSGLQLEGLSSSGGHQTVQLAPITLQPNHGNAFSGDISQLMSQLSHGLSTGSLQLQPVGGSYQLAGSLGGYEGHSAQPQYTFAAPKFQQYSVSDQQAGVPSYAAGTKGLGSYGSGSTGPVLFNPADSHNVQSVPSYSSGSSGHSFPGFSSSPGHSFGGASFKTLGAGYGSHGKTSFKPSAFLGSSVQSEGTHGISALSTHAVPSFGHSFSGGHAPVSFGSGSYAGGFGGHLGGGSSKYITPSYAPPKSAGFTSSLDASSAFSGHGHLASPPGTTYGTPSASYGFSSNTAHAGASSPQYYLAPSKQGALNSFSEGSSSYKAPLDYKTQSFGSLSSGPKYSFGGQGGQSYESSYSSPKDSNGAYSEPSYNTIRYSQELKPRPQ